MGFKMCVCCHKRILLCSRWSQSKKGHVALLKWNNFFMGSAQKVVSSPTSDYHHHDFLGFNKAKKCIIY